MSVKNRIDRYLKEITVCGDCHYRHFRPTEDQYMFKLFANGCKVDEMGELYSDDGLYLPKFIKLWNFLEYASYGESLLTAAYHHKFYYRFDGEEVISLEELSAKTLYDHQEYLIYAPLKIVDFIQQRKFEICKYCENRHIHELLIKTVKSNKCTHLGKWKLSKFIV